MNVHAIIILCAFIRETMEGKRATKEKEREVLTPTEANTIIIISIIPPQLKLR